MKTATQIALYLLLLLFVNTLSAAEIEVFGPKQYLRAAGSPNLYSNSFKAAPKEGRLVLKNGNYDGLLMPVKVNWNEDID